MKKIALFLLIFVPLFSCAKQEPPKQAETPPAPAPQPVAEVTLVKGQVRLFCDDGWCDAAAGKKLLAADSIDLSARAVLELKDSTGTVIKLSDAGKDATAAMIERAKAKPAAPVKPLSARTQASINKLAAKPKMEVTTPTAVAGVRGAPGRRPVPADTSKKDTSSHK